MLHKTDNLIMADCILRLIRFDKRLKHIDGIIKPYIDNDEQGFTIELLKIDFGDIISFAVKEDGQILVSIYDNALKFLDEDFQYQKLFPNDHFIDAKEYITNVITSLIRNAKLKNTPFNKYNAL